MYDARPTRGPHANLRPTGRAMPTAPIVLRNKQVCFGTTIGPPVALVIFSISILEHIDSQIHIAHQFTERVCPPQWESKQGVGHVSVTRHSAGHGCFVAGSPESLGSSQQPARSAMGSIPRRCGWVGKQHCRSKPSSQQYRLPQSAVRAPRMHEHLTQALRA